MTLGQVKIQIEQSVISQRSKKRIRIQIIISIAREKSKKSQSNLRKKLLKDIIRDSFKLLHLQQRLDYQVE